MSSEPSAAATMPRTSSAAPPLQRILAHAGLEARVLLSNGEQLIVALVLPAMVLIGLRTLPIGRLEGTDPMGTAVAATLATALISTSFTSQAIQTGFDRRGGVLTWIATTPLGRSGYLAGKILATLGIQLLQLIVLGGAALVLGWRPQGWALLAVLPLWWVGAAAFGGLGLLLAGTLRAEAVLALANLLFVLMIAVGGVAVPAATMPPLVAALVQLLPSAALADLLRGALGAGPVSAREVLVLLAWAVIAPLLVMRSFRWTSR